MATIRKPSVHFILIADSFYHPQYTDETLRSVIICSRSHKETVSEQMAEMEEGAVWFQSLSTPPFPPSAFPWEHPWFSAVLEQKAIGFPLDCYLFWCSDKEWVFWEKAAGERHNCLDLESTGQAENHVDPCFLGMGKAGLWTSPRYMECPCNPLFQP